MSNDGTAGAAVPRVNDLSEDKGLTFCWTEKEDHADDLSREVRAAG